MAAIVALKRSLPTNLARSPRRQGSDVPSEATDRRTKAMPSQET